MSLLHADKSHCSHSSQKHCVMQFSLLLLPRCRYCRRYPRYCCYRYCYYCWCYSCRVQAISAVIWAVLQLNALCTADGCIAADDYHKLSDSFGEDSSILYTTANNQYAFILDRFCTRRFQSCAPDASVTLLCISNMATGYSRRRICSNSILW
jgi:hypothetical protein